MKWSKYNLLFRSERNGWLLFNTVSRAFMSADDETADILRGIMTDADGYDYSRCAMLYMRLRSMGFLVEDTRDDTFYNVAKMRNLMQLYGDSTLSLTLAVTRACNFACSYCFECNRSGQPMSDEIEDKLIRFITRRDPKALNIVWYGGEPLLAFDRILSIDSRLKALGKPYAASMITNGYLLTDEKVAHLNDLKITYLQITLDGSEETHDSRRCLVSGGKTYRTILENVDRVMKSDFRGAVHIRVNVDSRNEEEFVYVYRYFREHYPNDFGKRIRVYPGFVKGDDKPESSCFFDSVRQGEFIARMFRKYGIAPLSLYPPRRSQSCTMTSRTSFVVGPEGEIYKCWDDVGIPERVVGSVDEKSAWDMGQIAEDMVAASYFDDPECRECRFFPICDGGCPRVRVNNLTKKDPVMPCSYFRDNIETLLELYYESKQANAK